MTHYHHTYPQSSLHQIHVISGHIDECVPHSIIKYHISPILTLHRCVSVSELRGHHLLGCDHWRKQLHYYISTGFPVILALKNQYKFKNDFKGWIT